MQLLERSRKELLDLSTRNRLLSIPVHSRFARLIQVHDELSEQVFRRLVVEKKSLSFLPGRPENPRNPAAESQIPSAFEADEVGIGLPQPEDEEDASTGLARRHLDSRLQTALSPEGLQRRLLDLYRDAQSMIEEQGVNILYLILGQLRWFEADKADTPRYAPLLLLPVELQRQTVSERFRLRWREEDLQENLSLRARIKTDFGLELPPFPEDEEFNLSNYFGAVTRAVVGAKGWEVLPNAITLGFFSFAKFLMYRDLDPDHWPERDRLLKHPWITGLLRDGFPPAEPLLAEDADLDEAIPASRLDHVVDADGSQTLAIEAVRQGRSVVIQGPPGTGKSQSITNIIATAILDGKRVLFVAEKLAAMEVVKRRLEQAGLGPLCLELHSHKLSKRAVLEDIGRAWKLGRPKPANLETLLPKLEQQRSLLNRHAASLHEPLSTSGLTPFILIGHLVALGDRGREAADLAFPGAENWTAEDCRTRRQLAQELAERVEHLGLPSLHPWRGVGRETVLKLDLDPLEWRLRRLLVRIEELRKSSTTLAAAMAQPLAVTFHDMEQQRRIADFVARAPAVDKHALNHPVWDADLVALCDLVAAGRRYAQALAQAGSQVTESTWEKDFGEARDQIVEHGRSWFRYFRGAYRRALAQLRATLTVEWPKTHADRLALINQIIVGQQAGRAIRAGDSLGQSAFGELWRKEKTDWNQVADVLDWVAQPQEAGLDSGFRKLFARLEEPTQVAQFLEPLIARFTAARTESSQLFQELCLDCSVAFGVSDLDHVPLAALAERCSAWLANLEGLSLWNTYFVRARRACDLGLAGLVGRLETGAMEPKALVEGFDRVYFGQMFREATRLKPELAQFDGTLHDRHVAEFRELDRERLALARYRTLVAHFEHLPPANSGVGATGLVKAELERKRGHRSIRRLLKDAGSVVQAIKPVLMMSPLSVAQFLEPGAIEFDLLVIDEASQVQPVDALGAIARCRQIVVVGDSRQLPPTRFFTRLTTESSESSEPDDADQTVPAAEAGDMESILGLCSARGLPQTMLRWHYRSRHHSLIAVSNREFYDNRLFIVPSPCPDTPGLGLKFHHLPDAIFDSGGSGANIVEARAIGRAIIAHARQTPDLSLGVAAFSIRQQQAIFDELELLRRENPETEAFFAGHATEPFFVKNLENVQGDERDVIFISVGYAKDAHDHLAMRFGPLSQAGGERRLNVLISRAKKRCEVFSSLTAADIDLDRASGRGVAAFKAFLDFAQTGRLVNDSPAAGAAPSPFEDTVRRAVESLGYEVHPQVGVAGFFIDLAVLDRERAGRYLLGIECDGAPYRSARFARDRDRLRQAVLEDHGWVLHRIWSPDWFQRPAEQLRHVGQAIERAKMIADQTTPRQAPSAGKPVTGATEAAIEREAVLVMDTRGQGVLARPYGEACFDVSGRRPPHDLPTKEMAEFLLLIVRQEGPIHEDELVTRVRDLWKLDRAGARVQDAVAKAIRLLLVTRKCLREDDFLTLPDQPIPIRNRENVSSPGLRKPDGLPPMEIRAAILALIDAHHGATSQEIPVAVARLFGFKVTSSALRAVIETQTARLLRQGTLEEANGLLKRPEGPPKSSRVPRSP